MSSCVNGFSHRFEPRYDISEQLTTEAAEALKKYINQGFFLGTNNINDFILRSKTYVCDICVACGEKKKR